MIDPAPTPDPAPPAPPTPTPEPPTPPTPPAPPPELPPIDAARAKFAQLQRSNEWRDRLLRGDPATVKEFQTLTATIAGVEDKPDEPGRPLIENELSREDTIAAVADLKTLGFKDDIIAEVFKGSKNSQAVIDETRAHYLRCMSDPDWTERLLAGGMQERREHALMCTILTGETLA